MIRLPTHVVNKAYGSPRILGGTDPKVVRLGAPNPDYLWRGYDAFSTGQDFFCEQLIIRSQSCIFIAHSVLMIMRRQ